MESRLLRVSVDIVHIVISYCYANATESAFNKNYSSVIMITVLGEIRVWVGDGSWPK